nr:FHA domain-containing protein [Desulfosarcina cetonica]
MPAIVTFTCIEGPLKGKIYSFQTRTTFLVGRSHECLITIPKSEESMEISRHHCMIEICPPLARIRDFGSLNGTYLNGKRIGSRGPSQAAGDPKAVSPQCDLANGDTIRMANIQFSVAIDAPEVCRRCGKEIPEKERSQCCTADNPYVCGACRVKEIAERNRRLAAEKQKKERAEAAKRKPAYPKKGGAAAPKPATVKAAGPIPGRAGAPDIMALVAQILEKARLGAPDVQNIKGYKILKTLGRGAWAPCTWPSRKPRANRWRSRSCFPKWRRTRTPWRVFAGRWTMPRPCVTRISCNRSNPDLPTMFSI